MQFNYWGTIEHIARRRVPGNAEVFALVAGNTSGSVVCRQDVTRDIANCVSLLQVFLKSSICVKKLNKIGQDSVTVTLRRSISNQSSSAHVEERDTHAFPNL